MTPVQTPVPMTTPTRLTPDEDGVLRRLEFFERVGARLSPTVAELKAQMRRRDARSEVRDPADDVRWTG